jgi:NTE family protein
VGGFYAAGVSAEDLEEMVLSYRDKRKVRRTVLDFTLPRYGLSKGKRLAKLMRSYLGDITFDELHIPFVAVATDIENGREVILQNGIVWEALRASGSVPVMFEPYFLNGRYLIDGGITNPLPTDILIERGMNIIISCAINSAKVTGKPQTRTSSDPMDASQHIVPPLTVPQEIKKHSMIGTLTRALGIMSAANTIQKARLADVDICPNVSYIDWIDFHRGDELVYEGEQAAEKAISAILELIHK